VNTDDPTDRTIPESSEERPHRFVNGMNDTDIVSLDQSLRRLDGCPSSESVASQIKR
jgi:hypothetical protein